MTWTRQERKSILHGYRPVTDPRRRPLNIGIMEVQGDALTLMKLSLLSVSLSLSFSVL